MKMAFFESLLVALSTYSAVPVPQFEWNDRNMKYAICFFPAVGVICGGFLYLWYAFCQMFSVSGVLFAAVATGLPLLITGGIHMDGFMDTVDALASHQSRERKLEILKDSHLGAFAAIYCGVYLLIAFGLLFELYSQRNVGVYCPVYVLSRSLSAFCAVRLPNARKSGMLNAYTKDAVKQTVARTMLILDVLCCCVLVAMNPVIGAIAAVAANSSMLIYRHITMKQFGGVTGDTSGFFLQICELAALTGIWLGGLL